MEDERERGEQGRKEGREKAPTAVAAAKAQAAKGSAPSSDSVSCIERAGDEEKANRMSAPTGEQRV